MSECPHQLQMINIQFGFVVFEKCFHCNSLRTYFSMEDAPILGDKYREGDHFWSRVENRILPEPKFSLLHIFFGESPPPNPASN